jgi:hypothetical protein
MRTASLWMAMVLVLPANSAFGQDKKEERPQELLLGEWVNLNKEATGVKRLVVSKGKDGWSIEAWGAGGGANAEIPWRKVHLHLLGDNSAAKDLPYGFAT